ncbi:arylsulfotransferase [Halobacteriales archaeon QS_5_70_15]|nr:MAG: arylsulfotransferase [Halobacteriales archaeon QS_5_70_15]
MDRPSRPWLARAAVAFVVVLLLVPASVSAVSHERTGLGPGTVSEPAEGTTYVAVQGFHFKGVGNPKKPARLVSATREARGSVITAGEQEGVSWFYDVDPLPDGNLLVTSTTPTETVVFELDPETNEQVWTERLPIEDTHDVELLPSGRLLVANMREYEEGVSDDRVFVYDRENDSVVWEYVFREHYPNSTARGFQEDWTHVNDVDRIAPGKYLVSPRNFDQAVVIDRGSKTIEYRLGSDDNHTTLYEQHNPDWLESEDGNPTMLVADSENDRVVEYELRNGSEVSDVNASRTSTGPSGTWVRTWSVDGFNWPRDADRLPNGNTLVVDTLNHRVVEIAPNGTVVWEFYASWGPYDAERGAKGSNGPTMTDIGGGGEYTVSGGADRGPAGQETFSDWLIGVADGSAVEAQLTWFAERYRHATPFLRPVWMSSWALAGSFLAVVVLLLWALGELVYQRGRLARALVRAVERVGVRGAR